MKRINVLPFGHRQGQALEYWFNEPRDIDEIVLTFAAEAPDIEPGVWYMRKSWPEHRWERVAQQSGFAQGWQAQDDWYNCQWQQATVSVTRAGTQVSVRFQPLSDELAEAEDYPVTFRRTLGVRLELPPETPQCQLAAYTTSPVASGRFTLCAGPEAGSCGRDLEAYNCVVQAVREAAQDKPTFAVDYLVPAAPWLAENPLVTVTTGAEKVTFNLLEVPEQGVYAPDFDLALWRCDTVADYDSARAAVHRGKCLYDQVKALGEQTLQRAVAHMVPPDKTYCFVGVALNRSRFALDVDGNLFMVHKYHDVVPARDTPRLKWQGRQLACCFGLQGFERITRGFEEGWLPVYQARWQAAGYQLHQRVFAVPVEEDLAEGEPAPDALIAALVEFELENTSAEPVNFALPVAFAESAGSEHLLQAFDPAKAPAAALKIEDKLLVGEFEGKPVVRAAFETARPVAVRLVDNVCWFKGILAAQADTKIILKVPFGEPSKAQALEALCTLDLPEQLVKVRTWWKRRVEKAAQLHLPDELLTNWYKAQLVHIWLTDEAMPANNLVQCTVGTLAYGNFTNEACMVIHSLDRRGLHEEARRRLEVYFKYQGTAAQPGNFSDCEGMFYGAGGYECGAYNQHHGWALWALAEHYRLAHDAKWLKAKADAVAAGCHWVIRQRKLTRQSDKTGARLLHFGFLPAGSLEDVTDFFYWLSTNALTWRGLNEAASVLKEIGHPDAPELQREAQAYGEDLRRGLEEMRRLTPLVKLRDGSWVPHYPSRLYCRGRDAGWIREVLEGAIYLLISGLYPADGPQAEWILRDYEDTLYVEDPWGYPLPDFDEHWFDRGGFSKQPNLLTGWLPYLWRDDIKHYLRAIFNAFAACWRPEENLLIEHPAPLLGTTGGAHYKTSDESNSLVALLDMLVSEVDGSLYYGRALPRQWLKQGATPSLQGAATTWGATSVEYHTCADASRLEARLKLPDRTLPDAVFVRFRHPTTASLVRCEVDGQPWEEFDAQKEWVRLEPKHFKPGQQVQVVAWFE